MVYTRAELLECRSWGEPPVELAHTLTGEEACCSLLDLLGDVDWYDEHQQALIAAAPSGSCGPAAFEEAADRPI